MSQHAVIFLRHVVANRVKIGYTVSIELYINDLLEWTYAVQTECKCAVNCRENCLSHFDNFCKRHK